MKKLLALISASVLLLTSCSSDDNKSSNSTGTLLSQIIETFDDGSVETLSFVYNGNKIVRYSWDSSLQDETIFTYTGNLITKEEYFFDDGAGDSYSEVMNYEYNSNGKLIKSIRNSDGGDVYVDDFTYNTNGTVSFTTTHNSVLEANGMIYFNGNQPYRKEVTQYPGETYETTWVEETFFDNNVNPFNSVIGLSEIEIACPIVNVGYQGISNNATEVKIDGVTDWVIVLAYNANNMPDTEDFTDPSNPEYNSTSQYIYN